MAAVVEGEGAADLAVKVNPDALPVEVLKEGRRNEEPVLAAGAVELASLLVNFLVFVADDLGPVL
jgi:hypothetical protein